MNARIHASNACMSDHYCKLVSMNESMPIYIHIYIYTYIHIYIHTYACMHACMHGWMDGWMDGCMYTYIHTYIHTHRHTYIHTYMHTQRQADRQTDGMHLCIHACHYMHSCMQVCKLSTFTPVGTRSNSVQGMGGPHNIPALRLNHGRNQARRDVGQRTCRKPLLKLGFRDLCTGLFGCIFSDKLFLTAFFCMASSNLLPIVWNPGSMAWYFVVWHRTSEYYRFLALA